MHSYIATATVDDTNRTHMGGWCDCIGWARRTLADTGVPVLIFRARAGEKHARLVAELSAHGERMVRGGALVELKILRGRRTDGP